MEPSNLGADLEAQRLENLGIVRPAAGLVGWLGLPTSSTNAQHQVQCGLLLDVVVRDRMAILELPVTVNQAPLLGRDAPLVLDDGLEVVDGGVGLHIECDGLPSGVFTKIS